MQTLTVLLNGKTAEEVAKSDITMSVNWEALIPALSEFVRLREYENIEGLLVSDTDIKVKIGMKRGRRVYKTKEVEGVDNND